ncbi:MAG: DUF1080 domain-containing protein [Bryobacterales bacterium]|nr:DUF1080 domain-containing protein [Bryobacterales bacterium]
MRISRRTLFAAGALARPLLAQEDYTPIFDGTSLRGWTIVDGPDSSYYVDGGAICVSPVASFPAWLRSERQYENFDLRGEFFIKGWTDSGLYFHAPEHGHPTMAGFQWKVFHQKEDKPSPQSMGAVFPYAAPLKVTVHEGWNEFRILADWPRLRMWCNGEPVQDLSVDSRPELVHKLRSGYFGIVAASAPCRFRNLRVKELPSSEKWITLYESAPDFANWTVSEGKPDFFTLGSVLRGDGAGHLAHKQKFRDFELQLYIRGSAQHNGGVLFRSAGRGLAADKHYEIQLHPVEEAHFPTGSLYHLKRAIYPRIEDEKWFLMQLIVKDKYCLVRIDGQDVMEYNNLEILDEGFIELQAHRRGYWIEFKHVRIKPL